MDAKSAALDLLQRVQRPPDGLPAGASTEIIADFSVKSGVTVPEDFQNFLLLHNGALVGARGIFGIQGGENEYLDLHSNLLLWPGWAERGWLPISGDGCGNYYLVATRQEFGIGFPVFFVETRATVNCCVLSS